MSKESNNKHSMPHELDNEYADHRPFFRILGMTAFFVGFCISQLAGYGLASLLFRWIGRPTDIIAHVIAALIGMICMLCVFWLVMHLFGRKQFEKQHGIHTQLTDAMAQIAQGNFNVLLDTNPNENHHEMADAFNDMVQKLGDLETMRQDFISNVSHEIQSPLTSIGGFASLLQNANLAVEDRVRYAEIIGAESKRLSSLSDNLLKLTALEKGQKPLEEQEYRLDKQLEKIALTLEPQWSAKNIVLEADLQKCTICGDVDLLSQVWINLFHNAIKFTPANGQISIMLKSSNDSASVKISDTGAGIDKDDLPHIFERFYKADKSRDRSLGGNGLGLSLVKKIVELHSGQISVESEISKGTSFEISLPFQKLKQ